MKKVLFWFNVISLALVIIFTISAVPIIRSVIDDVIHKNIEITHIAHMVTIFFLLTGFTAAIFILFMVRKKSEIAIFVRIFFTVVLLFVTYQTCRVPRIIRNTIQASKPLEDNVNVLIKNRVTIDKKYYWLELNIRWKIDKIKKSDIKVDIPTTKKLVNTRMQWEAEYAVFKALRGIPSYEFVNKLKQIEKNTAKELKKYMRTKASYQSGFNIDVTILKYKFLDNRYEGSGFPPGDV